MNEEHPPAAEARTEQQGDPDLMFGMLGAHLRELTSNLMRIVRGSGKPHDIMSQMASVLEWLKRNEANGGIPVHVGDLHNLLLLPSSPPRQPDAEGARSRAIEVIVNGALQVAASRLIRQSAFERHGEQEILSGIAAYRDACEADRKRS